MNSENKQTGKMLPSYIYFNELIDFMSKLYDLVVKERLA